MDFPDNYYTIKRHPDTQKLLRQVLYSFAGLLLFSLLTVGLAAFFNQNTQSSVILGSQTP